MVEKQKNSPAIESEPAPISGEMLMFGLIIGVIIIVITILVTQSATLSTYVTRYSGAI